MGQEQARQHEAIGEIVTVPYEKATTGEKARGEVVKMLRKFGCESVGYMDDFANKAVILGFKHRGRPVQLKASATGWATMWKKANPYSYQRGSREKYETRALTQGMIAVDSILRDWVKGQITAVECGIMSFEAVFVGHMLTNNGQPLFERLATLDILPPMIEGPRA